MMVMISQNPACSRNMLFDIWIVVNQNVQVISSLFLSSRSTKLMVKVLVHTKTIRIEWT
jgi:hypothetical protein